MKILDIERALKELGFEIDEIDDHDENIYAHNDKVMIRFMRYQDRCDIGFQQTFDRWSNSSDITHRYPYTFTAFGRIIASIDQAVPCKCQPCDTWVIRTGDGLCKFHVNSKRCTI